MLKLNFYVKIMCRNIIFCQVRNYKFCVKKLEVVVIVLVIKFEKVVLEKGIVDKKLVVGKKGKKVDVKKQKFVGKKVVVKKLVEKKFIIEEKKLVV